MSEPAFVRHEQYKTEHAAWRIVLRLAFSMPLILYLLPFNLLLNFLASASPAFFRWYAGVFSGGSHTQDLPLIGSLPISLHGLLDVALLAMVIRILAWACFELGALWSAQHLYQRLIATVMRTRTRFYDENPGGRMSNRLVQDFNQLRTTGLSSVADSLGALIDLLSVLVLSALANVYALLLMLPLLWCFVLVQRHRESPIGKARAETAMCTSRLIDRKNDLVRGRASYLLYGRFDRLRSRLTESYLGYLRAAAFSTHLETWYTALLRLATESYVLAILIGLTLGLYSGKLEPVFAGVIFSALFSLNGSLNFLDVTATAAARQVAHSRRVFEYLDLPPEEQEERATSQPVSEAVEKTGNASDANFLVIKNLAIRYRPDSPLILQDIDLSLRRGEKLALIGRTGGGKTTLIQALMRLVYVQQGDIRVGGQSLYALPIAQARRLFGVIPQQPYLFAGTLRANLDRAQQFDEEVLRQALADAGLDLALDSVVAEGGENFSLGERQLICIARTLAANKPIVLLDEPTSGLDPQTDVRIQQLLTRRLADTTVITVAHRLESLGHYDRVVEIDAGRIKWTGKPSERRRAQPLPDGFEAKPG